MEKRSGITGTELIGLTRQDVDSLTRLYNARLAEFGRSAKTVGWNSESDQHLRFEVLCRGLNLESKRILDVGCGLGDFVPWAEKKFGADFDYVGIDLSENLVADARERFAGDRRTFLFGTLGPGFDLGGFDFVFSSGAMSFRTSDNIKTMRALLVSAWAHTTECLSANFLSSYVDFQEPKNYHYKPEEVFSFAKSITSFASLHHDYPLYEFTIQMYREPRAFPDLSQ